MLRIGLFIAAGLVGLVLLVAVIGWCLPKAHRASRTATVSATVGKIFARITDVADAATWRSDVKSVEIVSGQGVGMVFRETGPNGVITYRVEVLEPNRRLVTAIADPSLPFSGTWTFDLSPRGESTEVTITEEGEVSNPIFRFMSRFFFSQTETMERYLADLAK
jgi:uncharacterized protein YndB with AHSA1/START domain